MSEICGIQGKDDMRANRAPLSATRPLPVLVRGLDQGDLSSRTVMDPMTAFAIALEAKRANAARRRGLGGAVVAAAVMAHSLGTEELATDEPSITTDDDTVSPSTT